MEERFDEILNMPFDKDAEQAVLGSILAVSYTHLFK